MKIKYIKPPEIVSRERWEKERKKLLKKEKDLTRKRDELAESLPFSLGVSGFTINN